MILVSILSLVAIASAVVMLMVVDQESGVERTLRFREASQAAVLVRAGELSAAVALRRDATEAPESDHSREEWAKVVDREASIQGGTFTLTVTDAQGRYNLNSLTQGGVGAPLALLQLVEELKLPPRLLEQILSAGAEKRPFVELAELRELGVDAPTLARLAPLVTVLPEASSVNINAASEELIALFMGDAAARMLVAQRRRRGFITQEDVSALGLLMPAGMGFTSNYYWVRTTVRIGETSQTLTSLIQRVVEEGQPKVVTVGRWRGAAAPDQAPPFQPSKPQMRADF